jgi:hypothetical protein
MEEVYYLITRKELSSRYISIPNQGISLDNVLVIKGEINSMLSSISYLSNHRSNP